MKVDLHTHSVFSDGTLTPTDLVQLAAAAGVELLALTDHDTIDGLPEAQTAARSCGIGLLPGVEISANWGQHGIHILGYGFECASPALVSFLGQQRLRREIRAERIGERLARCGIDGALVGATQLAGGRVPGRAHFARYLVQQERVPDFARAFKRYLAKGRRGYVAAEWPQLPEVVAAIHQAGGLASLAHPHHYKLSKALLRHLLLQFKSAQGDGVEIVTAGDDESRIEWLAELAVEHRLAGSMGSDFHSLEQVWRRPGSIPAMPTAVEPLWGRWNLEKTAC